MNTTTDTAYDALSRIDARSEEERQRLDALLRTLQSRKPLDSCYTPALLYLLDRQYASTERLTRWGGETWL